MLTVIDGFVLKKTNGMSYCLKSLLSAMPIEERKNFIIVIPNDDIAINNVPDLFKVKTFSCDSFIFWSNFIFPFYLLLNYRRVSNVLYPANTTPFLFLSFFNNYLLLHDIMFLKDLPTSSLKHKLNHYYYKYNLLFSHNKMKKIFTVSEFSKNDILSYFNNLDSKNIIVIEESSKQFPPSQIVDIPSGRFYLGVCFPDSRKNTNLVVDGFLKYLSNSGDKNDCQLVLFGDNEYWLDLKDKYKYNSLFLKKIHFVGRVSDAQLAYLYKNAHCFLFPSSYEGFGLPVLESMSFGTPVIMSSVTSLGEVGGDAGVYIKDFTVESIVNSLCLLNDQGNYSLYSQLSYKNVKRYSWERSVNIILENTNNKQEE